MRILIAEDDSSLASFVKKGLDAEHYAVDVSSDGEQARAMAGEFDYDLVVLDLSLPRLDGVAILRYLRTRKPSMPIIVLTGRARVEDRVECLDLGADDYLGKPFSFSELSARIRAALPSTGGIGTDGGRLEARPGRAQGRARGTPHHARHDHRARMEFVV
jgi:DNA-binding response OmpR family regulator